MTKLSVVIPFLNAAVHLPRCLAAISRQDSKAAEFIFVDNGSRDDSINIINAFTRKNKKVIIQVFQEKRKGASAARNTGASHAKGEWLVFTDADCIPAQNWLTDILTVTSQASSDIGAFAGCIMPWPSDNIVAKFLGMYTLPSHRKEKVHSGFTLVSGGFPTANLIVRKDVFIEIGGFDETILIYGEDHDLCAKIYKKGKHIKVLTKAVIYHNHRSDIKGMIRQAFGFGRAHALGLHRMTPGIRILQVPGKTWIDSRSGKRIWLDFNQADKKLFIATVLCLWGGPLKILPFLYFIYLCISIYQRGKKRKTDISCMESPVCAALLLGKSLSMTLGRLWGASTHKVICI